MKICANCGVELRDDDKYCAVCDSLVEEHAEPECEPTIEENTPSVQQTEPEPGEDQADPEINEQVQAREPNREKKPGIGARIMGVLSYIFFFVPLVFGKGDFVKYHVNQGAVVFLGYVSGVALAIIPYAGVALGILTVAFNMLCSIAGIVGAAAGKKISLPIVARFQILK